MDDRRNSIIAHAPPDKMEVIEQTVEALDVPPDRGSHILQHLDQMKVYRLSTMDPQPLVDILKELGQLSPTTKIEVDESTKSLLVYGSLADHVTVQSLVTKLDGSMRSFEVIPLRRLRADAVAATIQYMLGEEEEENQSQSRYYGYSSRYSRSSSSEQEDKRPFRVDADIENNRLLLWANEVELTEVQQLLVKMGEMPSGTGSSETLRVIDLMSDEDAEEALERLRRLWPAVEPNRLQIEDLTPPAASEETPLDRPVTSPTRDESPRRPTVVSEQTRTVSTLLALHQADLPPDEDEAVHQTKRVPSADPDSPAREPDSREQIARPQTSDGARLPEVTIQRGPNGRLIIGSPDTRALDRLEDMLSDLAPPRRDYQVFRLRYPNTWAYGIELTLEEIFAEELKDDGTSYDPWFGFSRNQDNSKSDTGRLSQRKPLKIISDEDTRTILVQGATASQLEIIEDIIQIYDQPQSGDPQSIRQTEIFRVRYSQAKVVADTVKAVYRDLLSENDPALQSGKPEEKSSAVERSYTYVYGGNSGRQRGAHADQVQGAAVRRRRRAVQHDRHLRRRWLDDRNLDADRSPR